MEQVKKTVRRILRESINDELIDMILDKVSKYGEKSLLPHEKDLMDRIATGKTDIKDDLDLIFDFLDFTLGKMNEQEYAMDKLGRRVVGIRYYDKTERFVFDYEVNSEIQGAKRQEKVLLVDDKLMGKLIDNFTISKEDSKKALALWFEKATGNSVSKIQSWISGED